MNSANFQSDNFPGWKPRNPAKAILARAIHANPALAKVRLIMLTSTNAVGKLEERQRAGILRCVNKPHSPIRTV